MFLNSVPWIPNPIIALYFKRLHFPKHLTLLYRAKTPPAKKNATYFTGREKYSGNNFVTTVCRGKNIYNWLFSEGKDLGLYNWVHPSAFRGGLIQERGVKDGCVIGTAGRKFISATKWVAFFGSVKLGVDFMYTCVFCDFCNKKRAGRNSSGVYKNPWWEKQTHTNFFLLCAFWV